MFVYCVKPGTNDMSYKMTQMIRTALLCLKFKQESFKEHVCHLYKQANTSKVDGQTDSSLWLPGIQTFSL